MGAAALDAALDEMTDHARAHAPAAADDLHLERLEALWAGTLESMRGQLAIDEHLRDSATDFEDTLQLLLLARTEEEYRSALDDLAHHAAMLSALLASPVPA